MNEEEIKDTISKGYRDILKREPDPGGLANYIREFQQGLTKDGFHDILRSSDEYKQIFGTSNIQRNTQPYKVAWCQITCPDDITLTKDFAKKIISHVDMGIIITDEYVRDEDKNYLRSLGCDVYTFKWEDNTSQQRNHYLEVLEDGTWVCVNDPDEPYHDTLINDLRDVIKQAEEQGISMIFLNTHDIWIKPDGTEEESITDYYKPLIFKYRKGVSYTGQIHEIIDGYHWRSIKADSKYLYYHRKTHSQVWRNACRNYFCEGGGDNLAFANPNETPEWFEFRSICSSIGINSWKEFDKYLKIGNIDIRIKDWIIKYKDINTKHWHSEIREIYLYYFNVLHPEEEPLELKKK